FFFFNDTATTEIYTLSLHDALPISARLWRARSRRPADCAGSQYQAPAWGLLGSFRSLPSSYGAFADRGAYEVRLPYRAVSRPISPVYHVGRQRVSDLDVAGLSFALHCL